MNPSELDRFGQDLQRLADGNGSLPEPVAYALRSLGRLLASAHGRRPQLCASLAAALVASGHDELSAEVLRVRAMSLDPSAVYPGFLGSAADAVSDLQAFTVRVRGFACKKDRMTGRTMHNWRLLSALRCLYSTHSAAAPLTGGDGLRPGGIGDGGRALGGRPGGSAALLTRQ